MNKIKELLDETGIISFRAGSSHNGEYHSSCPGCGDGSPRSAGDGPSDRFQIWPEKPEGVVYYCRKCGKHGDSIQFCRDFLNKTYHEACAYLGLTPSGHANPGIRPTVTPRPPLAVSPATTSTPPSPDRPSLVWITKATAFANWCHEQLLSSADGQQLLASRGLSLATARRYKIGYNPGENGKDLHRARKAWGLPEIPLDNGRAKTLWLPRGLVMPLLDSSLQVIQLRIRRRPQDVATFAANLPYQIIEGSCHATMVLEPQARAFVIVESGLDAYLLAQDGAGLCGAVTTWNAQAKPDNAACAILDQSLRLLISLDNDQAGAKASIWWQDRFPQARRWPVPMVKDPGEARVAGIDLRQWLLAGLPPAVTMADPDLLSGEAGKEPENTKAPAGQEEPHSEEPPQPTKSTTSTTSTETMDEIHELANLLSLHQLRIIKNRVPGEVRIQWSSAWRHSNPLAAARLSDLVFKIEKTSLAIHRHPAMVIHGGNLLQG